MLERNCQCVQIRSTHARVLSPKYECHSSFKHNVIGQTVEPIDGKLYHTHVLFGLESDTGNRRCEDATHITTVTEPN